MTTPLRIGIAGIFGRMGQETAQIAESDSRVELVGGIVRQGSIGHAHPSRLITSDSGSLLERVDCLIDLSGPQATAALAESAARYGVPLLCGVTGLEDDAIAALRHASETIPVHWSRNLSRGVPLIASLLKQLAAALNDFDVEITETHHRGKRDAPSGTAELLAGAVAQGRGQRLADVALYGRFGESLRTPGEIGVHSLRAGALPGEHTVLFAGDEEEIRISHRALTRRAFARGAIEAALELPRNPPGFYQT